MLGDKPLAAIKTLLSRTKIYRERSTDPRANGKMLSVLLEEWAYAASKS
jgi:hypothetical protein